jgi:hypothetical protein
MGESDVPQAVYLATREEYLEPARVQRGSSVQSYQRRIRAFHAVRVVDGEMEPQSVCGHLVDRRQVLTDFGSTTVTMRCSTCAELAGFESF